MTPSNFPAPGEPAAAVTAPELDPRRAVVLETEPSPRPQLGGRVATSVSEWRPEGGNERERVDAPPLAHARSHQEENASAAPGTVRVVASDNDTLTIDADVTAPALLLITDLYSEGWRVRSLGSPVQANYEILPANYILRAVPLAAGPHRLRLEYRPRSLTPGLVLSLFAWVAWLGALIVTVRRPPSMPAA